MASLYDLKAKTLEGKDTSFADYSGQVALVVNLASECGLTPQYSGLESLYRETKPRGFVVLGFPCNQFGAQEPGTPEQIREFCSTKFDVSFPVFEKVEVKGPNKHEVYDFLTQDAEEPDWNFAKYLVGKDGKLIKRFAPPIKPDDVDLLTAIDNALKA